MRRMGRWLMAVSALGLMVAAMPTIQAGQGATVSSGKTPSGGSPIPSIQTRPAVVKALASSRLTKIAARLMR